MLFEVLNKENINVLERRKVQHTWLKLLHSEILQKHLQSKNTYTS